MNESALPPPRPGPRPRTTPHAPHSQLDQLPPRNLSRALSRALAAELAALPDTSVGGSPRAPRGTIGFHLDAERRRGSEDAFLLGREFAHVHVEDDGSLHAILPEPLRAQAIAAGWAEPHPLAGQPTVSPDTVMIYAPRDEDEVAVVLALVRRSWANARGGS